jgi:hypothetical protein
MTAFQILLLILWPPYVGEVAAQEQARVFIRAMTASKGEGRVPKTRGEVAAQEQARIFIQAIASMAKMIKVKMKKSQ